MDPRIANDTTKTFAEARALWWTGGPAQPVHQDPGAPSGLPAITQCLSEGISVNVTLIFCWSATAQVIDAFMAGLEGCGGGRRDLSRSLGGFSS